MGLCFKFGPWASKRHRIRTCIQLFLSCSVAELSQVEVRHWHIGLYLAHDLSAMEQDIKKVVQSGNILLVYSQQNCWYIMVDIPKTRTNDPNAKKLVTWNIPCD